MVQEEGPGSVTQIQVTFVTAKVAGKKEKDASEIFSGLSCKACQNAVLPV